MPKCFAPAVLALLCLPWTAAAADVCTAPAPPALPETAAGLTRAALDAAAQRLSAYTRAMHAYQECLDSIITDPASHTHAQWRAALKAYNASAPALEKAWQAYQTLKQDWSAAHRASARQ